MPCRAEARREGKMRRCRRAALSCRWHGVSDAGEEDGEVDSGGAEMRRTGGREMGRKEEGRRRSREEGGGRKDEGRESEGGMRARAREGAGGVRVAQLWEQRETGVGGWAKIACEVRI
jgi:hypothetical protein